MKENHIEVSVIVPNYCHAKFLDKRIQSILNQTYQKFELIIMDDCSHDDGASKAIIEKYRCNPHISHILYNETNSGSPFKQWDKGIGIARGKYVWIAESDDLCEKSFLEKMVDVLDNNDTAMVFCKSIIIDENCSVINILPQKHLVNSFCMDGDKFIKRYLTLMNTVMNISSVVFKRKEALIIDDQYKKFKGLGDWIFLIEMAERGRVCFVNENLNYFRRYATNTTRSVAKTAMNIYEEKIIYDYLDSKRRISWVKKVKRKFSSIRRLKYDNPNIEDKIRKRYLEMWGYRGIYKILFIFINSMYKMKNHGQCYST